MTRIAPIVLAALLAVPFVGCATRPRPEPMPPTPTAAQIEDIRAAYRLSFPEARVGVVTAVLDGQPYVLISQIETATVRTGQIITFLDAEQSVLTNGTVVKVDPEGLTVQYDDGMRAPRVGDAAVNF